jgi:small subunit ribosomal protein S2
MANAKTVKSLKSKAEGEDSKKVESKKETLKPTTAGKQVQGDEKKKVINKTVNLTGKKTKTSALVMKAKKNNGSKTVDVKKLNEVVKTKKEEMLKKQVQLNGKSASSQMQSEKREEVKVGENQKPEIEDKKYNLAIGPKELLAAGCHLGHKVAKTSPKSRDMIYGVRDGISIIDLMKTQKQLEEAANFLHNAVRRGKKIVLLGTKRQAREVVKRVAEENGIAYITGRWLGGTISNWEQVSKSIKRLKDLKDGFENGKFGENTKKEQSLMRKEMVRLEDSVGGLINLDRIFDILIAVDAGMEKTAIKEASARKITTVALCDTDSDPYAVNFAISANDDSVKSINLIIEEIGRALKAGKTK